jgi:hypothetical protein
MAKCSYIWSEIIWPSTRSLSPRSGGVMVRVTAHLQTLRTYQTHLLHHGVQFSVQEVDFLCPNKCYFFVFICLFKYNRKIIC